MTEDPRVVFKFLYDKFSEKGAMPRDKLFKTEFQKGVKMADDLYKEYLTSNAKEKEISAKLFGSLHIPAYKNIKGKETPVLLQYQPWLVEVASKQPSEPELIPESVPVSSTSSSYVPPVSPRALLAQQAVQEEQERKRKEQAELEEVARQNRIQEQATKAMAESARLKQLEDERVAQLEREAFAEAKRQDEARKAQLAILEKAKIMDERRNVNQISRERELRRMEEEDRASRLQLSMEATHIGTAEVPVVQPETTAVSSTADNGGKVLPPASKAPIHTTSVDPKTSQKSGSWFSIFSRLPTMSSDVTEKETVKQSTPATMAENKTVKDASLALEVSQIQNGTPIHPPVAENDVADASMISAGQALVDQPQYALPTVTAPASHFNTPPPLAHTPEGQPEEMQTVDVEPLPTSSVAETHKPNTNAWGFTNWNQNAWNNTPASGWKVDPATGTVTTTEDKTKSSAEKLANWWKTSENAPRADIKHRFGDYVIAPTRNPLISTDKAVGILSFPQAYEPWKYISQPRPYMLSSSLNKYQYYPSFHQAQNLKTTIGVR